MTKRRAFFLDRDGVINRERSYITRPGDLELLPGVPGALCRLHSAGYLAIVVTNQSMVARGMCSMEALAAVHERMHALLAADDAAVDAVYFCPHYAGADVAKPGNPYHVECECRKPRPGMILQALQEWDIDPAGSWMLGDSSRDLEAGVRAGVPGVGVGPVERFTTAPERMFASLGDAVTALLD